MRFIGLLLLVFVGFALLMHKAAMRDPNYRLKRAFENHERALRRR